MSGPKLVVNLTTNVSHFEGWVKGLITPSSTQGAKTDNKGAPDPKGADPKATPKDAKTAPKDAPKSRASNPSGLY
jgi:hypothetical protein